MTNGRNCDKVEIMMGRNEPDLAWTALNLLVGSSLNGMVSHFAASVPTFEDCVLPFVACNHHLI